MKRVRGNECFALDFIANEFQVTQSKLSTPELLSMIYAVSVAVINTVSGN